LKKTKFFIQDYDDNRISSDYFISGLCLYLVLRKVILIIARIVRIYKYSLLLNRIPYNENTIDFRYITN
jgi:hypothetical protein